MQKECIAYNKSLGYKSVEGCYDGEYKQGEMLGLSVFPDKVENEEDDNWGEMVDFTASSKIKNINNEHNGLNFKLVAEKDLDFVDIDDLVCFNGKEMVI